MTARKRPGAPKTPADRLPVARVMVDVPLAHLDRAFDYFVEQGQDEACVPGCRVRVRFAGQLVDGWVLERVEASEHPGRMAFLERVVSPEPALVPEIAALVREVADRWAGTFADVVRLAVPPRHAAAEQSDLPPPAEPPVPPAPVEGFDADLLAPDLRAVVAVPPGDWPRLLATCAAATLAANRGVVIVVPDHRDVARVSAALDHLIGAGRHVVLAADLGPAERYRRFMRVRRGAVRCVVGTRAAVWAPVQDLGRVIVWDDGDDLHAEPRAPYCHARDVAVVRAHRAGAGLVVAGHAVTAEGAALVESGWARAVEPTADRRRAALPGVRPAGDDGELDRDPAARAARLPSVAWRAARDALAAGQPVLVQVPRQGYQVSLQCAQCRAGARCARCAGPLARTAAGNVPACRWCGTAAVDWTCPSCGDRRWRAGIVGAARTAEELGRAFPGTSVRASGGDAVLARIKDAPALVIATPGAEPVADAGYGAVLLLDGWMLLARPDLRAGEEALRRWLNAAALARPGGAVVVVAPGELRAVQALVRWAPRWHAERELDERRELHLPPAARMAALTGPAEAVSDLLDVADLPTAAEVLGPVPVTNRTDEVDVERLLVRVPRRDGSQLTAALRAAAGVRSARKRPGAVRIEVDPVVVA